LNAVQTMLRRRNGQVVPSPIEVDALIDSGADISCVDPSVLVGLNPTVKTVIPTNVPAISGLGYSSQYIVDMTVLDPGGNPINNLSFRDSTLTEINLNTIGIHALIGRDILSRCVFTFNGPTNTFSLNY